MKTLVSILFIVFTGTNAGGFFSAKGPYFSYAVLVLFLWFAVLCIRSTTHWRAAIQLGKSDTFFWALLFAMPLVLMGFSETSFARGDWTSQITLLAVYALGVQFWFNNNLRTAIVIGALLVAMVGSSLNLYEFFVTPNLWSVAPGRSAGWYGNPNVSAASISIYGIIYLTMRGDGLAKLDLPILGYLLVGVLVTFSRGGYVLFLTTIVSALFGMRRSGSKALRFKAWKAIWITGALVGLAWIFVNDVLLERRLSEDASTRLASMGTSSITENYMANRGVAVEGAWRLVQKHPWSGLGPRTSIDMQPQGPHNMFIGIALDYGIGGLAAYVVLIVIVLARGVRGVRRKLSNEGVLAILAMLWLILYSLASHNILYDAFSVLALSWAVAASASSKSLMASRQKPVAEAVQQGETYDDVTNDDADEPSEAGGWAD